MSVPAARDEARRITGEVSAGRTPQTRVAAVKKELTLQELFDWYLVNHAKPHKTTWREDQRNYEKRLKHWGHRRLSTITRDDVKQLHIEIGEKKPDADCPGGHYAANKMLELLGFMWEQGKTFLHLSAPNPTEGVQRFPAIERERFLTTDEIGRFIDAVQRYKVPVTRDVILMALLTGARRSNVCCMRWEDLDIEGRLWTIPAKSSKSKRIMRVILCPEAVELLEQRRIGNTSKWVFPSKGVTGHVVEPKHAMRAILVESGICKKKPGKNRSLQIDPETHVRFHDLRRTLGSWQAMNGTSLIVIGKSLGHTSQSATKVYARLQLDPVRDSVEGAATKMMASAKNSEKSSK